MTRKKKILILTADAGFGHRSAANAVASAILDSYGSSYECNIVNPVDDPRAPEIIRKPQADWDRTARTFPHSYRISYSISDSLLASMVVESVITQFMMRVFQDILKTYTPDVVISTYAIYNTALRSALKRNKLDIPFFLVITDLAHVHHMWFQLGPDKFFVPTEQTRQEAIRSHISPQRVLVSGLPIDPRFAQEKRDKTALRQSLGWNPKLSTVLAVGSKRVRDLFSNLKAVDKCGFPLQLVVVAGGNDELFEEVCTAKWNTPVFCYNYVCNLPEMLHAADLLITKAGGLITSEALACGLPIIFVEAIPGQETGNVRYVCEHSAGTMAKTPVKVQETLCKWLADDRKVLNQYSLNAIQIGKPEAAYQIAREVCRVTAEKPGSSLEIYMHEHELVSPSVWNG